MLLIVVAVAHVIGIATCVHAVMTVRTSQGAIAWGGLLVLLPYVAVPAYWVLGRSRFRGYTAARYGNLRAIAGVTDDELAAVRRFAPPAEELSPVARAAERLAGLSYLRGKSIELLVDGESTYRSILDGIEQAREYVLFQFFIVRDDEVGRKFQDRLIERARSGVRVYFLYDEIGSIGLSREFKDELRQAGVEVTPFCTRKGPGNWFQLNFRNHRKVVVVDGAKAWIGGHNIGEEHLGRDTRLGRWRDTHVAVTGPAALAMQLSFAEDWHWATGDVLELGWNPQPAEQDDIPVLVLPTGPADDLETTNLMFVHAINSAEERIWIGSAYFVPDPAVMVALQLAGLRGVDVRILIPDRPDHLGVYLASFSYLDEASHTGVEFHRYQGGFLHEKVMLIDQSVVTIGTANFDNRSSRLNFEITVAIMDEGVGKSVEQVFEHDFARSRRMEPGELERRPWWFRFGVRLARLTAPIQ